MGLFGGGSQVREKRREQGVAESQRTIQANMRTSIHQNTRKVDASGRRAADLRAKAKLEMRRGNKPAALRLMKQAKLADRSASNTGNRSFALETQSDALDTAIDIKRDMTLMQETSQATSGLLQGMDGDSVGNMMGDVNESMAGLHEIEDEINGSLDFSGILGDDDDIEADLTSLLEEDDREQARERDREQAEHDTRADSLMLEVQELPDPPGTSTGRVNRSHASPVFDNGQQVRSRQVPRPAEDFSEFM